MPELALIFCAIVWAAGYLCMKLLVEEFNPMVVVAYRYGIGAICLLPIAIRYLTWSRQLFIWGGICGTVLFLLLYPMAASLVDGSVTNAGFIIGLFVAIVPLFSYLWYGTKLSFLEFFAVLLSIMGLWVLTGGVKGVTFSDLLMLISAILCAFHVLFIEHSAQKKIDLYALSFVQSLTTCMLSVICVFFMGTEWKIPRGPDISIFLFIGALASGLCLVLQLYGQKQVSAWRSCLIYATEPIITVVIAHLLINEPITKKTLIGGALIIFAIILPGLPKRKLPPIPLEYS